MHKSPLADKGKEKDIPSVADFQAYARVGLGGAEAFKQLKKLAAGKMTERLRGKLSALEAENRFLDGELIRTTRDLRTYRDQNLVLFSEENRCLKDELKQLEGVQRQLDEANPKLIDQSNTIVEIPTLKTDLKASQEKAKAVEARKEEDAKALAQLQNEKVEFKTKLAHYAKAGFNRCLMLAVVLEPGLNMKYLDAKYKAVGGKIMHQNEVVFRPGSAELHND